MIIGTFKNECKERGYIAAAALMDALVSRDTDKVSGYLNDNIIHESIWHDEPVTGKENVIEFYKTMGERYTEAGIESWGEIVKIATKPQEVQNTTVMVKGEPMHADRLIIINPDFGKLCVLFYARFSETGKVQTTLLIPTLGRNGKIDKVISTAPAEYDLLKISGEKQN